MVRLKIRPFDPSDDPIRQVTSSRALGGGGLLRVSVFARWRERLRQEPVSAADGGANRSDGGVHRVLLVASTGGHLAQVVALRPWWGGLDRVWVTFEKRDALSLLKDETVVWAHHPTTRNLANFVRNGVLALSTLRADRPDLVFSNGAGVALPFFLVARSLRIPTAYLEVYDRIDSRTLTGRLCRHLSSTFMVQWPEQIRLYPGSTNIGPVLGDSLTERNVEVERPTSPLVLVTVGSDHHRFDRLIDWIDEWIESHGDDSTKYVIQHGASRRPRFGEALDFVDHDDLESLMQQATLIVSQGGPMSMLEARSHGSIPIVVPRLRRFNEVVDDHQVAFSNHLGARGLIRVAQTRSELFSALGEGIEDPASFEVRSDDLVPPSGIEKLIQEASTVLPPRLTTRPDVLFLGGFGRSGSTLLERMLGQVHGVTALGEVIHLPERGLLGDELCGCGESFHTCGFWLSVGKAMGGWDNLDPHVLGELRQGLCRNARIPNVVMGRQSTTQRLNSTRYLHYLSRLYSAARDVSGSSVLVDSSKHPAYAFLLRRAAVNLRVVLVVRDSRGVAYSWAKQVRRPEVVDGVEFMPTYDSSGSAWRWNAYNSLFHLLGRLGTPLLVVRYEDLVRDPKRALERVLAFSSVDPAAIPPKLFTQDVVTLAPDHTVAGNPMRFQTGPIQVTQDEEWRTAMPRKDIQRVSAITRPLLTKYRYPRKP